jgi:hypothetical protein
MGKNDSLIEQLRKVFVTIEVFNLRLSPIEKIVYGATAAIGLAIVGALMALLLRQP